MEFVVSRFIGRPNPFCLVPPPDKSGNYEWGGFPILVVKFHYREGKPLLSRTPPDKSGNYEKGGISDFGR
jgi:hypothetical protein